MTNLRLLALSVLSLALSCHSVRGPSPAPPVYLNHFYAVLDADTYAAIGNDPFVKERFAAFDRDSTSTGDGASWSGTYLDGRRTYIEFFPPTKDKPEGTAGIGLGVERPGDILRLEGILSRAGVPAHPTSLMTRVIGPATVPWFYSLDFEVLPGEAPFEYWVMEYHPDYLRKRHPERASQNPGITRADYQFNTFDASRVLEDVIGLTLALERQQWEPFRDLLRAAGYAIAGGATGFTARGPGVEFRIVQADAGRRGVVSIRMSTTRQAGTEVSTVRLGRSRLDLLEDRTAVWQFGPPDE